jgi:tRNA threonylcarbamoyladenosine biosynthesis protein TsaB
MMPHTIALDGSTYTGSVALVHGNSVIVERTLGGSNGGVERAGRGESLMPAIAECLAEAGITRGDIARIVCGAGPGSFTSLRVAGSVAKGLAVGYGVELYSVSSLVLTVAGLKGSLAPGPYLSLLNAMRDEFFAQRVEIRDDGSVGKVGRLGLISAADLADRRLEETAVRCIGPGQEIDAFPHARGVARLIGQIEGSRPVDISSWEPDYGRLAEAQVRWEAEHGRPLPK